MPYLNVKLSTPLTDKLTKDVASTLTHLTAEDLKKRPSVTAIAIEHVPAAHWFIGDAPVAQEGGATFYLDIKVTDGTNTKDEKSRYIENVFAAMQALLGPLNPTSYIVIHDVRADAWGFGGQTQEARYIRGKAL